MLSFEHPGILRYLDIFERVLSSVFRRNGGQQEADRNLGAFYEKVWREAADRLGASIEHLGQGVLEVRKGEARTRVLANTTSLDDLATHCVVRSKPVIYKLLARQGLPVPRHLTYGVNEIGKAAAFLADARRACVVKPAGDTGGGLGVTTGVRNRYQLGRASWAASRGGRSVLIEEQIEGDNFRLLYLDGKLLDAVLRKPPVLVADGRRSIEAMIKAANQERLRDGLAHSCISFNMDLHQTLRQQKLQLRSVPPQGTVVRLKTVINENSKIENQTVLDAIGADLRDECAQAARIAGVRLAGVDVITKDPTISLNRSGGVILEVNSPPGFFWHYNKHGEPFPVAVHALRALLDRPAAPAQSGDVDRLVLEPRTQ